ncbi:MAG: septum site-determining protein MinC [Gammaproteobacteria bacterium]
MSFVETAPTFELKGSLFTLTVMHLLNPRIDENFITQLRHYAQNTPNLFKNMPLVVDLQKVDAGNIPIDFETLKVQLRQQGLVPVGVRSGNEQYQQAAQQAGLAILASQGVASREASPSKKPAADKLNPSKIVTKPVRSGQQIYAKKADLIVVGPVSHGAELLADGNIHVYGNLRGRALAGVTGNTAARIFCSKLEAELVSIAGYYKLQDELSKSHTQAVQVFLENTEIKIEDLT